MSMLLSHQTMHITGEYMHQFEICDENTALHI